MGTDWEAVGVLAAGISEGTWKRFLAGKVAINAGAFRAYCQVLELDWQAVAGSQRQWRWPKMEPLLLGQVPLR
ncbi:hypothetical protein IQ254_11535 [Nodosilinea sp. LEGE 07088]|uniref:hypothetical protein n=1 Tax=Nodosilinea sp. LEGE 07088 TaxID=2777968 RepID=UPI00187FBAC6|nr:hypothetical protein [Nodosilinea sp. LEGE 07088]MBE9137816.1 hypothetical protein [Nodosilinea sp. LEGE 07088]